MTRGQQGPPAATYSVFDGMIGEREMGVADWPATQLYQESRSVFGMIVQCDPDSANGIWVGSATGQWLHLRAGESLTIPICDPSMIYVEGDGGQATVNWMAML